MSGADVLRWQEEQRIVLLHYDSIALIQRRLRENQMFDVELYKKHQNDETMTLEELQRDPETGEYLPPEVRVERVYARIKALEEIDFVARSKHQKAYNILNVELRKELGLEIDEKTGKAKKVKSGREDWMALSGLTLADAGNGQTKLVSPLSTLHSEKENSKEKTRYREDKEKQTKAEKKANALGKMDSSGLFISAQVVMMLRVKFGLSLTNDKIKELIAHLGANKFAVTPDAVGGWLKSEGLIK